MRESRFHVLASMYNNQSLKLTHIILQIQKTVDTQWKYSRLSLTHSYRGGNSHVKGILLHRRGHSPRPFPSQKEKKEFNPSEKEPLPFSSFLGSFSSKKQRTPRSSSWEENAPECISFFIGATASHPRDDDFVIRHQNWSNKNFH